MYDYGYRYQDSVSAVLYIIADHRKKIAGFNTEYAGWIKKKEVEELTASVSDQPWVSPKEKKYFLTKLTRQMDRSLIDSDLIITNADTNKLVNAPNPQAALYFWIVMAVSIVLTAGFTALIIRQIRQSRSE